MKVTFYKTCDHGQTVAFVIKMDAKNKVRVVEGNAALAKDLGVLSGPIVGMRGKEMFPKNGRAYMEAMRIQFSGSYIRAGAVGECKRRTSWGYNMGGICFCRYSCCRRYYAVNL